MACKQSKEALWKEILSIKASFFYFHAIANYHLPLVAD